VIKIQIVIFFIIDFEANIIGFEAKIQTEQKKVLMFFHYCDVYFLVVVANVSL
jgi:hypothetical protein